MSCGLPTDFCICIDLRAGAKFIGVCCLAFSFISSIFLVVYLSSDFESIAEEISDSDPQMIEQLSSHKTSAQVTASILLVILILYFISAVFLIKGARNKSRQQLQPFLICTVVLIIVSLIVSFLQFNTGSFYAILTLVVVLIYLFMCVYAYHKQLSIEY